MSTNSENLVKISPVYFEITGEICQFSTYGSKSNNLTGSKDTKFLSDVSRDRRCYKRLRSANLFRNADGSVRRIKVREANFATLAQNWLPWQRPLSDRKKRWLDRSSTII